MVLMKNYFMLQGKFIACLGLLMMAMCLPLTVMAESRIGLVKTYQPIAKAIRAGVEVELREGAEIFEGDILVTGPDGAIGIIFSDGAVLTLGPSGKLVVEKFLFMPDEKRVSFLSNVMKGSVAFVSGAIGRISPDAVQFKTPTATLGLRGTKILINVD